MGERNQNIRQIEMGERIAEMFDRACEHQKSLMERQGKNYRGVEKDYFMAKYRIETKVGIYASKRYFKDFKTIGTFIQGNQDFGKPTFKVSEEQYQTWLKKNYPEETTKKN